MPTLPEIGGKWGTECLNTRFSASDGCIRDTAWSWFRFKTFSLYTRRNNYDTNLNKKFVFFALVSTPPEFGGKWGTECLNTRFSASDGCVRDTAWSWFQFKTFSLYTRGVGYPGLMLSRPLQFTAQSKLTDGAAHSHQKWIASGHLPPSCINWVPNKITISFFVFQTEFKACNQKGNWEVVNRVGRVKLLVCTKVVRSSCNLNLLFGFLKIYQIHFLYNSWNYFSNVM